MPMPSLIPASVLHFPRIFLQVELKSICEDEPHCKYDQGLCRIVDPDPNALFRHLPIMDTILIAVKEFMKVVVLFFFLCRGRVPPVQVHFFCANSPINCLLALVYQPVRVLHVRRPSVLDLVLHLLFDGLCEDIPQLLLQLVFVYSVSRTGLSVLQVLSLFLTALGVSTIILRLTLLLLRQCWKTRVYRAQEGVIATDGCFAQLDTSFDLAAVAATAAAAAVAVAVVRSSPPSPDESQIPIPGLVEARDDASSQTSHLSLMSVTETTSPPFRFRRPFGEF